MFIKKYTKNSVLIVLSNMGLCGNSFFRRKHKMKVSPHLCSVIG